MVGQPNKRVSPAHSMHAGDFEPSPRSDRIREEIDSTRHHLDGTIDEIQHRLTPEQILQRTMASFQRAAWNGAGKAVTVAKEHPLPAAMIGAGVMWLAKQLIASASDKGRGGGGYAYPSVAPRRSAASRVREKIADTAETISDGVKHAAENVTEGVRHAGSSTAHAVSAAAASTVHAVESTGAGALDAARTAGSYVADAAGTVGSGVQRSARKTAEWTDSFVHEYPLGAAAACFALGLAGGLAVPATRKEDQLLGDTRDRLMREAGKAGSQLLQQGEAVVTKAGGAVAQAVERQVDAVAEPSESNDAESGRSWRERYDEPGRAAPPAGGA